MAHAPAVVVPDVGTDGMLNVQRNVSGMADTVYGMADDLAVIAPVVNTNGMTNPQAIASAMPNTHDIIYKERRKEFFRQRAAETAEENFWAVASRASNSQCCASTCTSTRITFRGRTGWKTFGRFVS